MFGRILRELDAANPVADYKAKFEQLRTIINSLPFSPVKKQVLNSFVDYYIKKFNNLGFFSAAGLALSSDIRIQEFTQIFQAADESDDVFLERVKLVTHGMTDHSERKTVLLHNIESAKSNLQERRAAAQKYTAYGAAAATLYLLYQYPWIAAPVILSEVITVLNVDCRSLINQILELYDSTGYITVNNNGEETRQLASTYQMNRK
jgi:hypothetical protein